MHNRDREQQEEEQEGQLTEYVVTRWYRAPEIMCSSRRYDKLMDVWSVGCILSELYLRKPLFPGNNHIEQLTLIFHYLGTPSSTNWIKTPDGKRWAETMQSAQPQAPQDLKQVLPGATDEAVAAIARMLTMDPKRRVSVRQCLESAWLRPMYAATKKHTGPSTARTA